VLQGWSALRWCPLEDPRLIDALRAQGIRDERVLEAMATLRRADFVEPAERSRAWRDEPLPIGEEQTISQPYVVARMTEALEVQPGERVLEVGTGSGYQTAVLLNLGAEVFSVELRPALAERAYARLVGAFPGLHARVGDGFLGWPEASPFDAIVLTAAPSEVPEALLAQLRPGGRLVGPVGPRDAPQQLVRIIRHRDGSLETERLLSVRFVPMTKGQPRS
jgi:protein-L-isoaspartate(D-aspartate) O-methyltransferase